MYRPLTALVSLPLLLVYGASSDSARTFTGTYTNTLYSQTCTNEYGSSGSPPTPLPTSDSLAQVTSVTTLATTTVPSSALWVTANVTTVVFTSNVVQSTITVTDSAPSTTVTSTLHTSSVIGTVFSTAVVCTNNITAPASTSTVYNPSVTSPDPSSFPTQVDCTYFTSYLISIAPTVQSGIDTYTATPTTTSVKTVTTNETTSVTDYATTVTTVVTSVAYGATSANVTTSVSCPATTTTTYAAKCAPTNLISGASGHGVEIDTYAGDSAISSPSEASGDPSLCCQLCLDNQDCAAMAYLPLASSCGLVFTGDTCSQAYTYKPDNYSSPAGSWLLQTGCGSIELVE